MTTLDGLRMNFYMEHNERGDNVAGFFLDKNKQEVCTMMRDRVRNNAFRLATNFQPMCTGKETQHTDKYDAETMSTRLKLEFRNFQVKLKWSKTNVDAPPKLIFSGKKGFGTDDIVLALTENSYFHLCKTLSTRNETF